MNELIIFGVIIGVFTATAAVYAVVGIAYYKLVLHSKKSIFQIICEL